MPEDQQNFLQLLAYVYLQNARPDKAAVVLAALDTVAPGQRKVLCSLALAQVRSGKAQRALDTLDRLALAGGVDATFHLLRAQALGSLERQAEAAAAMQTYLQMRPLPAANAATAA
jgi:Flp pilus assembly protein TadD